MSVAFQNLFQSKDRPRDKFLSRVFGIFNEEIVRCWCQDNQAPYRDLGRPTIKSAGNLHGFTLDFAFQAKDNKSVYVGEMKCELEYENYRYLTLESPSQLDHHKKEAFRLFLDIAQNPQQHIVTIGGKPQSINGAILVWGSCTAAGRASVMAKHGLHDVLSLESIVNDLIAWENKDFIELLDKYQTWSDELFTGLRVLK